jgi:hypothetical protein
MWRFCDQRFDCCSVWQHWGRFLTSPLRANFEHQEWILSPWCEVIPGVKLSVHPWGWRKGWTFPIGDKVHPWGSSSPLGSNFTPGGKPCFLTVLCGLTQCWLKLWLPTYNAFVFMLCLCLGERQKGWSSRRNKRLNDFLCKPFSVLREHLKWHFN